MQVCQIEALLVTLLCQYGLSKAAALPGSPVASGHEISSTFVVVSTPPSFQRNHNPSLPKTLLPSDEIEENHDNNQQPKKNQGSLDSAHNSSGVLLMVQLGLGFFFFTFVFVKIYKSCSRRCKSCMADEPEQEYDPSSGELLNACYLCGTKVRASEWADKISGHRSECTTKSKEARLLLASMALVKVPCRKCGGNLRIWPHALGPSFYCQAPHCFSRGIEQDNDGSNRLTCFTCDYDMCAECGKIEVEFNGGLSASEASVSTVREDSRSARASFYKKNAYAEGFARIKDERASMRRSKDSKGREYRRGESTELWKLNAGDLERKLVRVTDVDTVTEMVGPKQEEIEKME